MKIGKLRNKLKNENFRSDLFIKLCNECCNLVVPAILEILEGTRGNINKKEILRAYRRKDFVWSLMTEYQQTL